LASARWVTAAVFLNDRLCIRPSTGHMSNGTAATC
jgi:hypothetical protein